MDIKEPAIIIYIKNENYSILKELIAGIEEEQVLYKVYSFENEKNIDDLAKEASAFSIVGVGIGVEDEYISLHFKNAINYGHYFKGKEARVIGQNAARYVKKKPFIIN